MPNPNDITQLWQFEAFFIIAWAEFYTLEKKNKNYFHQIWL